jgi:hypothetical protein
MKCMTVTVFACSKLIQNAELIQNAVTCIRSDGWRRFQNSDVN